MTNLIWTLRKRTLDASLVNIGTIQCKMYNSKALKKDFSNFCLLLFVNSEGNIYEEIEMKVKNYNLQQNNLQFLHC